MKRDEWEIQGYLWLYRDSVASLGYMRPCIQNRKENKKQNKAKNSIDKQKYIKEGKVFLKNFKISVYIRNDYWRLRFLLPTSFYCCSIWSLWGGKSIFLLNKSLHRTHVWNYRRMTKCKFTDYSSHKETVLKTIKSTGLECQGFTLSPYVWPCASCQTSLRSFPLV